LVSLAEAEFFQENVGVLFCGKWIKGEKEINIFENMIDIYLSYSLLSPALSMTNHKKTKKNLFLSEEKQLEIISMFVLYLAN
jgi:hypothetical protein